MFFVNTIYIKSFEGEAFVVFAEFFKQARAGLHATGFLKLFCPRCEYACVCVCVCVCVSAPEAINNKWRDMV